MIDIHSHYLPYVDDGSPSAEISLKMLEKAVEDGVTDVILTPHYRGKFKPEKETLLKAFSEFQALKEQAGIPVRLYLGEEVYFGDKSAPALEDKEFLTLAGSKYLLMEFSATEKSKVYDAVRHASAAGYIPVVAHIERYFYLTDEDVYDIKSLGALIQVNAGSIAGKVKKYFGKQVMRYLKNGWVDLVASDFHHNREYCMKKAFKAVSRKFGEDYAERIFWLNAEKITGGCR